MDTNPEVSSFPRCSVCGGLFSDSELIPYGNDKICASCKPAFFQKLKEGATLPIGLYYAGFWKRAGARFIDGIIYQIINFSLFLALGVSIIVPNPKDMNLRIGLTFVMYFFMFFYEVFFIGRFGATPGKMALKIKVINADGSQVGYLKALGRLFANFLSGIILGIGYIMAAFDDEKRALHDRICNTRVIMNTKD